MAYTFNIANLHSSRSDRTHNLKYQRSTTTDYKYMEKKFPSILDSRNIKELVSAFKEVFGKYFIASEYKYIWFSSKASIFFLLCLLHQ